MAAWILNRPIGIIAILPILLLYKEQKIFLFSTCAGLLLYGLFILTSPFEKSLWRNYMHGMQSQIKRHQSADLKEILPSYMVPEDRKLEGIDFNEVDRNIAEHPIKVYSENGNFFVIYRKIMHHQISTRILNGLLMLTILSLLVLFYYAHRKNKRNLLQVLIFGFTLYMIIEIFSPIYRHQYNAVQWFPLILSALLIPAAQEKSCVVPSGHGPAIEYHKYKLDPDAAYAGGIGLAGRSDVFMLCKRGKNQSGYQALTGWYLAQQLCSLSY